MILPLKMPPPPRKNWSEKVLEYKRKIGYNWLYYGRKRKAKPAKNGATDAALLLAGSEKIQMVLAGIVYFDADSSIYSGDPRTNDFRGFD